MTKKPKAYSYLRFSTPEQSKGDSSRRQAELATKYAAANGLELDLSSYQDLGVSAYRGKNAKAGALRAFLDAVEQEIIPQGSYLLVESLDRISRDQILAAQGLFLQIIQAGVVLVTLGDQRVYSAESINSNPMDLIISLVTMIRANEESSTKARRLKASWTNKRAQAEKTGKPLTSRTPAWISLDKEAGKYVLIEDRARVVKRIFKEYLKGSGEHKLASTFNEEEVPTFGDSEMWHRSYIHKILTNPAVIGTCQPHKLDFVNGKKQRTPQPIIMDYFPPCIDAETYSKVQAMKEGSTTRTPTKAGISSVLAGLAKCPVCRGTMSRVNKGPTGGSPYLVCAKAKASAGCTYKIVKLAAVEDTILDRIDEIIAEAPSGDSSLDEEYEKATNNLNGVTDLLEKATEAVLANPSSRTLGDRLAAL
ncbi:MAG TPA: recombinase family protein, partial [Planctomycetota bacterium]|nr:recombinase family protein [Planctomycetota bacterium]